LRHLDEERIFLGTAIAIGREGRLAGTRLGAGVIVAKRWSVRGQERIPSRTKRLPDEPHARVNQEGVPGAGVTLRMAANLAE